VTPERLAGAWRRVSLAVGDGPASEPASVVWLQAGDRYADLRVPTDPDGTPASFAGTTSWHDPFLHWAHELDLDPSGGSDVGHLRQDGDDLVETGTAAGPDGPVGYTEVWRRLPGSDGPHLAMTREDGRGTLVRTGDHVLTVVDDRPAGGAHRACYRTATVHGWTVALVLGPGAEHLPGPPPDEPPPPGAPPSSLAPDHRWHVVAVTTATRS
jgi:hypothetical protein